ncbi:hypothetical protein JCM1840_005665 [Sporobolomyces johnsonii]
MLLRPVSLPARSFRSPTPLRSLAMTTSSTPPAVPAYLLHAPFLSIQPGEPSPATAPLQLLQRTLPPSPLYYLHPPPQTIPQSAPPALTLSLRDPIPGRISTVYRATSPSGAPLVLKYSTDFLALMREAEEVYVNLPAGGGGLPIPTFWGIFEGKVKEDQTKGMVIVMEDCGEPLKGGFDELTKDERKFLYDTLTTFHEIHFQHGSFSPSSITTRPAAPSATANGSATSTLARKLSIVGFSQAEWHLCPGVDKCKELVEAKKALGLE